MFMALQQTDRYRSFRIRTASTVAMIAAFIGVIYLGHVPLMALIFWIQVSIAEQLSLTLFCVKVANTDTFVATHR